MSSGVLFHYPAHFFFENIGFQIVLLNGHGNGDSIL